MVTARLEKDRNEYLRRRMDEDQKRSERRLRTLFLESRDMIYSSNSEDVVAMINNSGLAILGYQDRFDVVGRKFSAFALNPEDRQHFFSRVLKEGSVKDFEIALKRPDGATRFCLETAHLLRNPEDGTLEIQGIVKDITERITAERELWAKNLELAKVNQELRDAQNMVIQQEKMASIGHWPRG
jgi:PAS domain S-box-containing protein